MTQTLNAIFNVAVEWRNIEVSRVGEGSAGHVW